MTADTDLLNEEFTDETETEREAREATEVVLDEASQESVDILVLRMLTVVDELSGHPLYPYQRPFAARMIESMIINDGKTISALFSRQSGKSETVANVVAACMIMFPILAKLYPSLMGKFKEGLWVGAFAPVDDQADTLFGRIVARLTSERALEFLADPEIDDTVTGKGKAVSLKRLGSLCRKQTAHPRATIEGRTYHLILIDECQGADEKMVNKSIIPMGAATNATKVFTGTPSYEKGVFYKTIQINKRVATRRGERQNHFEADWRIVAKSNDNYGKYVRQEILRIGEDADEFKLAFRLMWLLDKGMFVTSERMDDLEDKTMQVVRDWHSSPVLIGIDTARKQDSTVVTVVWVDWDRQDEFGYYDHRILNWLDLSGMGWEEQYFRIVDFVRHYSVLSIGVATGGVGDVVCSRLKVLLPDIHIEELGDDRPAQSKRWKHLTSLMERGKISWPGHSYARRLKTYRRFRTQMEDAEKKFVGPYVLVEAPEETDAHDDYPDSLSMACILTEGFTTPEVEVSQNPFYAR